MTRKIPISFAVLASFLGWIFCSIAQITNIFYANIYYVHSYADFLSLINAIVFFCLMIPYVSFPYVLFAMATLIIPYFMLYPKINFIRNPFVSGIIGASSGVLLLALLTPFFGKKSFDEYFLAGAMYGCVTCILASLVAQRYLLSSRIYKSDIIEMFLIALLFGTPLWEVAIVIVPIYFSVYSKVLLARNLFFSTTMSIIIASFLVWIIYPIINTNHYHGNILCGAIFGFITCILSSIIARSYFTKTN